jgi:predicted nucleic acid-binding protein
MPPVLLDSSIYINVLRSGDDPAASLRRFRSEGPVWLSSVVLEELYAGARLSSQIAVESLERNFDKAGRILVPNRRDWVQAGKILARLAVKYDYEQIGKGRLTNDALIATSAARSGIEVITANARDFARLGEFHSFRWRVASR